MSKWEAWGKYARKNATHSVSKSLVNGEWIYQLWKLTPPKYELSVLIGNYKSFKEAEADVKNN